ncbi:hypothetical protein PAXRUDRAFT_162775, partial [Paxillus rubicundulus Ve08.2h10]
LHSFPFHPIEFPLMSQTGLSAVEEEVGKWKMKTRQAGYLCMKQLGCMSVITSNADKVEVSNQTLIHVGGLFSSPQIICCSPQ